jgi:Mg2+-importing ATPase
MHYLASLANKITNSLELSDICFMGTNVVSGAARGIVIGIGNRTYFGTLTERVTSIDRVLTAFKADINKVSWLLPMIVTSTLAKGAVLLSRKKVIVKRLDAIQTLAINHGNRDILAYGTLRTLF